MTDERMPSNRGNCNLTLVEYEGEPRVRDVVLGKVLGMARPRAIRQLIERHLEALAKFGPLATAHGKSRGQDFTEYLLSEEQAVYIVTQSDAPNALETKVMVVKVFVSWRHGHLAPAAILPEEIRRTDGIVRQTIHKVTGIERNIDDLSAAVLEMARIIQGTERMVVMMGKAMEEQDGRVNVLAEGVRSLIVAGDPRVAAVENVSALEVAKKHGVPPTRRRAFCTMIGNQMEKVSKAWDIPVLRSRETGKRLFALPVVEYWLNNGGKMFIGTWKMNLAGQGILAFPKRPRSHKPNKAA